MKKPKFKIGEDVVIVNNGRIANSGYVEVIERTFSEVNRFGEFFNKRVISENIFNKLEQQGTTKKIDEDTWDFDGHIYKFKDYRYYIIFDNGRMGTAKNYRIRNKEKFEAKLVAERLMKSK